MKLRLIEVKGKTYDRRLIRPSRAQVNGHDGAVPGGKEADPDGGPHSQQSAGCGLVHVYVGEGVSVGSGLGLSSGLGVGVGSLR